LEAVEPALSDLAEELGMETRPTPDLTVNIHPVQEWSTLVNRCGLDDPASDEAHFLKVESNGSAVSVHLFGKSNSALFLAAKTLRQLVRVSDGTWSIREATLLDWPETPVRGVLEGFYGTPWKPQDRIDMMKALADLKFNLYVYAPKADTLINTAWMLPYSPQELSEISVLLQAARAQRIRVCWELHTGLAVTFSSEQHFQWMLQKFRSVGELGVDCFVLAFDDILKKLLGPDEQAFGSYPRAQADFANRLAAALLQEFPAAMLGFVPIEYYTNHSDAETDLALLGQLLDPAWSIAWTGVEIVPSSITEDHIVEITDLLGRPPLLADNYPVSDMVAHLGHIHLGPLENRSPTLHPLTAGLVFNAMTLPWASLLPMATIADYAWNPAAYQPETSLAHAAGLLFPGTVAQDMVRFAMTNRSMQVSGTPDPVLDGLLSDLLDACDGNDAAGFEALAGTLANDYLEPFLRLSSLPISAADDPLVLELSPWLTIAGDYALAVGTWVDLAKLHLTGASPAQADIENAVALAAALASGNVRPSGALWDNFLLQLMDRVAGLPAD
jgi:hyaluronoglucosaminidase